MSAAGGVSPIPPERTKLTNGAPPAIGSHWRTLKRLSIGNA